MFKTVIRAWDDETIAQLVLTDVEPRIELHQIKGQDYQRYADDFIQNDRENPLSITRAPPHKLTVLDAGDDNFSLILSIHHVICDGWSLELLLNDLFETYLFLMGESKQLPNAPVASIKDVVAAQQQQAGDEKWLSYWQNQAWDEEYAKLPVLSETTAGDSRKVELYLSQLDQSLVDEVYETSRTMGVTGNSLWLSAYLLLLLPYRGGPAEHWLMLEI